MTIKKVTFDKISHVALNQSVILAIAKAMQMPSWKVAEALYTSSRLRQFVKIRQIYSYIRVVCDNASLKEVGNEIGGVDHSSVIHSRDRVQDQIDINSFEGRQYNECVKYYLEEIETNYKTIATNHSDAVFVRLKRLLAMEKLTGQRAKIKKEIEILKTIISTLIKQENNE